MKRLLPLMVLLCGCDTVEFSKIQVSEPEIGTLCTLKNEKINESSGVAISNLKKGLYWTHNDSGDAPNLFAFDANGNDFGTYKLKGITVIDCEDMESRLIDGKSFLFLGDIGDNLKVRKSVKVFKVAEPNVRVRNTDVGRFETMELVYPDGAKNCETLLVDKEGNIELVTKDESGVCGVYFGKSGLKSQTMKKLGEFKIESAISGLRLATGGCFSPDTKQVLIRTYGPAHIFYGSFLDWFKSKPAQLGLALEAQGEAICFDYGNKRAITTSEGKPCKVSFSRLP